MGRIAAINQAVEKAPTGRSAVEKQAVHLRRQPLQGNVFGQDGLGPLGLAIDMHQAFFRVARLSGGKPRADIRFTVWAGDRRRHGPGPGARGRFLAGIAAGGFRQAGAAQAATRNQKRQGFEDVGLARAVGPGQHDRPLGHVKPQRGIAAEVAQRQPANRKRALGGGGFRICPIGGKCGLDVQDRSLKPVQTRMGMSTNRALSSPVSRSTVGEAASAMASDAVSPSIWRVMSSR